jgi:hypothetical protein
MQTKFNNLIMHDNVFAYIAVATGILMSVPMVMTSLNPSAHINGGTGGGWDWSAGDYLVMAVLIFSTASLFVLSARRFRKHRLALGFNLFTCFNSFFGYIWLLVLLIPGPLPGHNAQKKKGLPLG